MLLSTYREPLPFAHTYIKHLMIALAVCLLGSPRLHARQDAFQEAIDDFLYGSKQLKERSSEELKELSDQLESKIRSLSLPDATVDGWDEHLTTQARLKKQLQDAQELLYEHDRNANSLIQSRLIEIRSCQSELGYLRKLLFDRGVEAGKKERMRRHLQLMSKAAPGTPSLQLERWDPLSFPRIDGSTSTQPLAMLIACRAFRNPFQWHWRFMGRASNIPDSLRNSGRADRAFIPFGELDGESPLAEYCLMAESADPLDTRMADFINLALVKNESTHQAYLNVITGKSDLAIIARPPIAQEWDYAKEQNVSLEVIPCAKDALVFLVHEENVVDNLTVEQLRSIYSGHTIDWKEFGGEDLKITPFRRPESSGSEPWMQNLVMRGTAMSSSVSPNLIGRHMSHAFLQVSQTRSGIAYSIWYYEKYMASISGPRILTVNGIEPSEETIRDGSYPLVGEVVLVMRSDIPPDSPSRKLRDWILSPEGQNVVAQSGYVPIR